MRTGARGHVLKHEEAAELWAAIRAVAAGTDWVSSPLAYILATDDAPDRPALSAQDTGTLRWYATGMPIKPVARRLGISPRWPGNTCGIREKYAEANRPAPTKAGPVPSSRRGRASPFSASARNPPSGRGDQRRPSSVRGLREMISRPCQGVMTPIRGSWRGRQRGPRTRSRPDVKRTRRALSVIAADRRKTPRTIPRRSHR